MVGLSLSNDLLSLHHRADFKPGMFVDLQNEVGRLGIQDQSLQKLYANLFHEKISKRQRLTNWEADALTNRQCLYAAHRRLDLHPPLRGNLPSRRDRRL